MFGVDSLFGAVLLLVILVWKGLGKIGELFCGLGKRELTDEEILEEVNRGIQESRKWLKENMPEKY